MVQSKHVYFFLTILFAVLVSQLSSFLVNRHMAIGESMEILPFLNFTHIRNMGGIFGIAQGKGWWFTVAAAAVTLGLLFFLIRSKEVPLVEYLGFGLVIGGGFSNVLDRIIYGSVIDFIDVQGIPYWKYIFNTADTMIHLGIWPMLIYWTFFQSKERPPEGGQD